MRPRSTINSFLTIGPLSLRLRVQEHQIRELLKRGAITAHRAGRYHLFAESDVPAIAQALADAGYIRNTQSH